MQTVPWGGNDVGVKGARSVLVEGIGGPCASCGEPVFYCEIQIEDDVLRGVRVPSGSTFPPEGYIVIKP